MSVPTSAVLDYAVPPRIGRIIAESSEGIQVEWSDGSTQHVRAGGSIRRVRPGGLGELYAGDPAGLRSALDRDPVALFVRALVDSRDEAKAADLQGLLVRFGLDKELVTAHWKKCKARFDKHPHVLKGSTRGSYRLTAEPQDPLSWIDERPRLDLLKHLTLQNPAPAERARILERLEQLADAPYTAEERLLGWALGIVEDLPSQREAEEVRLDDKSLALVLARAKSDHSLPALRLLATLPGRGRTGATALGLLPSAERSSLALAAVRRLTDEGAPDRESWLLARIVESPGTLTPELVHEALRFALGAVPRSPQVQTALDAILTPSRADLDLIRACLDSMEEVPFEALSRGSLDRGALRSRILLAVARGRHAELLQDPRAWRGVDVDVLESLAEHNSPLLEPLLASPSAPGRAILVEWLAGQQPTGRTLGRVLAWPVLLHDALPDGQLRQFVAAVREKNSWIRDAIEDPEVAGLRTMIDAQRIAAEESVSRAIRERDVAVADLQALQTRLEWVEQRLRGTASETDRVYEAQLRQARLDIVRGLCQVLDRVHGAGEPVAYDAALEEARRFGIGAIGRMGERVIINTSRHEVLGADDRNEGIVRRPGYEWESGQERIVVIRALVTS